MMRQRSFFTILYTLFTSVVLIGCADNDIQTDGGRDAAAYDVVGQPVLFSSGNMTKAVTRAGEPLGSITPYHLGMTSTVGVPYMARDSRFVCTMYYHAKSTDTDASDFDVMVPAVGGTMSTAWLKVNNDVGNSVYRKMDFDETSMTLDDYNFDKNSTIFYWQNRLTHAFLALADYNKLATNVGADTKEDSEGKLKMYPYGDKETKMTLGEGEEAEEIGVPNINVYDLTRGETYDGEGNLTGYSRNSITDQPDPILALTIMKPAGATQEANRVELYFRHQFSQIQVNVKCDASANITTEQIEGVELLGVSTEGYVYNHMKANGTIEPSKGKDVNVYEFPDAVLSTNPFGTSFQMFDMAPLPKVDTDGDGMDDRYESGFLKSYNAIAFGMLRAIRITWHEGTTEDPGVKHVSTFEVINASVKDESGNPVDLINLQSGVKYVYNLELRRGTLAIIRAEIKDWLQKSELVYGSDGTISN